MSGVLAGFTVIFVVAVYVDAKHVSIAGQFCAVPKYPIQPRSQDEHDVGARLQGCAGPVEAQRMIIGNKSASHRRRDEWQARCLDQGLELCRRNGPADALPQQQRRPLCRQKCARSFLHVDIRNGR